MGQILYGSTKTAKAPRNEKSAESRDDDTGMHIERTSLFCRLTAEKLYEAGLYPDSVDEVYAETISKASPLHDIG